MVNLQEDSVGVLYVGEGLFFIVRKKEFLFVLMSAN